MPEYSSPVLLDAQFDVEPETTYHYRVIRDGPSKAELSTSQRGVGTGASCARSVSVPVGLEALASTGGAKRR